MAAHDSDAALVSPQPRDRFFAFFGGAAPRLKAALAAIHSRRREDVGIAKQDGYSVPRRQHGCLQNAHSCKLASTLLLNRRPLPL
jgi:hypothetical protein